MQVPSDIEMILIIVQDIKSDVAELTKVVNPLVTGAAVRDQKILKLEEDAQSQFRKVVGGGALGATGIGAIATAIWKLLIESGSGSPPGH